MISISTIILLLNSLWDFISALSICARLCAGQCVWVSDAHLGLWVDESDRSNHAASAIMAALLTQWAVIRLHGALSSEAACSDAGFTYLVEATLVAIEVIAGNMHQLSGGLVVAACMVCWALVMRECV
jgi:hypothetical protein